MKYLITFFILAISSLSYSMEFDLDKFSNPAKYGWDNTEKQRISREDLLQRQKLLQIYELKKQNPTKNMLKSIIAPGWGHFSAKRYTKGQILLTSELILMGAAFYYYNIAIDNYNKYKNATYIIDINNYYENAKVPYHFATAFFSIGAVLWVYTVFDSAVVTRSYNDDLWSSVVKKYQKKKILITPTGVTLRF